MIKWKDYIYHPFTELNILYNYCKIGILLNHGDISDEMNSFWFFNYLKPISTKYVNNWGIPEGLLKNYNGNFSARLAWSSSWSLSTEWGRIKADNRYNLNYILLLQYSHYIPIMNSTFRIYLRRLRAKLAIMIFNPF